MRIPDPLEGYVEPWVSGRCSKRACECEPGEPKLCTVCEDEWAAMFADAEIHLEEDDSETDPWLSEVRDSEADDELFDRVAALEQYPDD